MPAVSTTCSTAPVLSASEASKGKEQQKRNSNKPDQGSPCTHQRTDINKAVMDDEFRLKMSESMTRVKKQDAPNGILYCAPTSLKNDTGAAIAVNMSLEDSKTKQRAESVCNVTNVTKVGPHDVLFGRGHRTNRHQGNINYRNLLAHYKVEYISASKVDKPKVSREVVKIWRNLEPPGRFLAISNTHNARKVSQDEETGRMHDVEVWHDVGNKKAQEKTSQCLRERTAQLHAAEGIAALFKSKFRQREEERKAIEIKKDSTYGLMAASANPSNHMAAATTTATIPATALGQPAVKRQLLDPGLGPVSVTPLSPSKKQRIDDVTMLAGTSMNGMVPAAPTGRRDLRSIAASDHHRRGSSNGTMHSSCRRSNCTRHSIHSSCGSIAPGLHVMHTQDVAMKANYM